MCRWRVLRTVEFASEISWGGFFAENQVWRYQSFFAPNFADKFRSTFGRQFSQANFAGDFARQISPANFARQISPGKYFAKRTPKEHSIVVALAAQFWVVVPKNLRNTEECVSAWCGRGRAMRPYGKADGAGLYLRPRRVTDTKQNCPCYERLDRTCTLQKDQGPQDRIHLPKNKFHSNSLCRWARQLLHN